MSSPVIIILEFTFFSEVPRKSEEIWVDVAALLELWFEAVPNTRLDDLSGTVW
jgi:hypothetical protein